MLNDRDYMNRGGFRRPAAGTSSFSIVTALIIANVVVFIFQMLSSAGRPPGELGPLGSLLALRGKDVPLEFWRYGTYMFAHGGMFHILINMLILYVLGKPVEERIGGNDFLYLYFVSGLIGGGIWWLCNWSSGTPVVGASGAVFGVMLAAAMLYPNLQIMLLFPPIPMKLKTFVTVFAVITVLFSIQQAISGQEGGGIAHVAHLGGFIGGFLYMRRYYRKYYPNRSFILEPLRRKWDSLTKQEQRRRAQFRKHEGGKKRESTPEDEDLDTSSENVDRILDKIGREGIQNLTARERKVLEQARKRLHQKHKQR